MKKLIIILTIVIAVLCLNKKEYYDKNTIRFRIIANSNSIEDQRLKKEIINDISEDLLNKKINTMSKERKYIKEKIPVFEDKIKNKTNKYSINYGKNHFPEKVYNGKIYKEGDYESLVITLGEGQGNNFWCILFPPLCMIDKEEEKVEYKSLLKEVINKII